MGKSLTLNDAEIGRVDAETKRVQAETEKLIAETEVLKATLARLNEGG